MERFRALPDPHLRSDYCRLLRSEIQIPISRILQVIPAPALAHNPRGGVGYSEQVSNLVSYRVAQNLGCGCPAMHLSLGCCQNLPAGKVLDSVVKQVGTIAVARSSGRQTERATLGAKVFRHRPRRDGKSDIRPLLERRIVLLFFCK